MLISIHFASCEVKRMLSSTRPFKILVIGLLDSDQQDSRNFCILMKDNLITMNCVILLIKRVFNFYIKPVFDKQVRVLRVISVIFVFVREHVVTSSFSIVGAGKAKVMFCLDSFSMKNALSPF